MSTNDYERFQTELEFASILGMPFMGTGNDPTSANNRNIEPWTLAGEKWEALNTLSLAWGIRLYPHNHAAAYHFLQDGPMVTVTEDRVTGAPIHADRGSRASRASASCSTTSTSPTRTCAESRWTSIWAHVAQHQWRWRYDWEGNRVEDIFDPLDQVARQTIRYPLYHAKDGDRTTEPARRRRWLHLHPVRRPSQRHRLRDLLQGPGRQGLPQPELRAGQRPGRRPPTPDSPCGSRRSAPHNMLALRG